MTTFSKSSFKLGVSRVFSMWYFRWQITRSLIWLAFFIAPKSAARDLFVGALNKASRHVMETIKAAKQ